MKMKKREKGFTLIELIGVIVIISVICIIVTPTIINQLNNKKEKVSSAQKQILFTAADQYLEQNKDIYQLTSGDIYCVSVSQLIADGLLKTPVIDATTGNEIDKNTNIKITVSHNENKTYDIDTTNACASVNSNDIQYTLTPTNNTWSKQKVLAITYPNVTGYVNSYSLDNGVTWTSVGSSTVSLTIKKETTVLAKSEGDITINKTILVSRVDSVLPVCTLKITSATAGSNGWYRSNVVLEFNNKSDEESGLASYGMGTSSTATYNSTTSITQSAETTGTTIYGYVKDNAGNENTCSMVIKKDTIAPVITASNITMYTSDVSSFDPLANVTVTDDYTSSITPTVQSSNLAAIAGTYTITYKAVDSAGNPSTKSITVTVKNFSCSLAVSGTQGSNSWYTGDATLTLTPSVTVPKYGIINSTTATYNSKTTYVVNTNIESTKFYGYIADNNGHTANCSATLKRDDSSPSISGGAAVNTFSSSSAASATCPKMLTGWGTFTSGGTTYHRKDTDLNGSVACVVYTYTITPSTSDVSNYGMETKNIRTESFAGYTVGTWSGTYTNEKIVSKSSSKVVMVMIRSTEYPIRAYATGNNGKTTYTDYASASCGGNCSPWEVAGIYGSCSNSCNTYEYGY